MKIHTLCVLCIIAFSSATHAQETTTTKDGFVYKTQDALGNTVQNGPVPDGAATQTVKPPAPPKPADTGLPGDLSNGGLKGDLSGAPLKSDMSGRQ